MASSNSMMAYNPAAGLQGMLKDGSRSVSDDSDPYSAGVVLRNIEAALALSQMLSTSLGPQGRCKLIVNHLEKIIVTADCASILKEVTIEHPAAQLLANAVTKQQDECSDQTAFCLAVAGGIVVADRAIDREDDMAAGGGNIGRISTSVAFNHRHIVTGTVCNDDHRYIRSGSSHVRY